MNISIGTNSLGDRVVLYLLELVVHVLICGRSGAGKSKLLEVIFRQLFNLAVALTLIDVKGHTADDFLAWIAEYRKSLRPSRLQHLVYLDPARGFYFDPFETKRTGRDYRRWLTARIESLMLSMVRIDGIANYSEMPRKARWTANMAWFCGVRRGEKKHIGLHRVFDIFDVGGQAWNRIFGSVEPYLPEFVVRDFHLLRSMSPRDRLMVTESTVNGFRRLFNSEETLEMFSGAGPSIDRAASMHRGDITIAKFATTQTFSEVAANVLSNLLLSESLNIAETTVLAQPHFMIMEEVAKFAGPDIENALLRGRAYKVPFILLQNDTSSFKTDKVDLLPKVLSQCGVQISFQQKNPEDLDILGKTFGFPNLDFTPHHNVVDRPAGYQIVEIPEESQSSSHQQSQTRGVTEGTSHTESHQQGIGHSAGKNRSNGFSNNNSESSSVQLTRGETKSEGLGGNESTSEGESDTSGKSRGSNAGESEQYLEDETRRTKSKNESQSSTEGYARNKSKSHGNSWNANEAESASVSRGQTNGRASGQNLNLGQSESFSETMTRGFSNGRSQSRSLQIGHSNGESRTMHFKRVPLAMHREELQETGKLRHSVSDQFSFFGHILSRLPPRYCLIRIGSGRTQLLHVDEVIDAFQGRPLMRAEAVEWFKQWIYSNHSFYIPTESKRPCPKPKGATAKFKKEDGESSSGPTTPNP